ncbi:MAG: adenosyl-hopene transferase HpnH [Chloroflexi bacterium]|nr:adenosyl-hopene transferase HpnH [Chloroflexota bacterium]MCH8868502.1 adenosyl-hopene transferase HpnH [Chloroflexota bacterium]MCI0770348.1 adenosyl-hopene transferase HpnH [Chloroflexota bacterium]MCI0790213.1 adenosyl-hopene transferase HpnH [Chloroflexota bacterium]MCI0795726.1 adenosyl-hopene transferase HpnH [Chloroflexota bacterium]
MGRPLELAFRTGWYIVKNKLMGRKRFPLVTMLEPLEKCNLACEGCGRIREYERVLDRTLSVEHCLAAVKESGAPIVSIAGGEPSLHPQIDEIVKRITAQKKFVFMCTNALLMDRMMKKIPPSKYFCFVVHMDGMEEAHDKSVYRKGVFKIAIRGIRKALDEGYRVTTNTTVFNGVDEEDLVTMFKMLTDMGIEGCMVSPGYQFDMVPNQNLFISRQNARKVFRNILDPARKIRFYNNPLYLDFLRGDREYQCTAWSNPTYTVLGWREPCYLIGDRHTQNINDLFKEELWTKRYGVGNDPRCDNCLMHCGFESASIFGVFERPADALRLVKKGAIQNSGIGTA